MLHPEERRKRQRRDDSSVPSEPIFVLPLHENDQPAGQLEIVRTANITFTKEYGVLYNLRNVSPQNPLHISARVTQYDDQEFLGRATLVAQLNATKNTKNPLPALLFRATAPPRGEEEEEEIPSEYLFEWSSTELWCETFNKVKNCQVSIHFRLSIPTESVEIIATTEQLAFQSRNKHLRVKPGPTEYEKGASNAVELVSPPTDNDLRISSAIAGLDTFPSPDLDDIMNEFALDPLVHPGGNFAKVVFELSRDFDQVKALMSDMDRRMEELKRMLGGAG